jgi:hypothetical protein
VESAAFRQGKETKQPETLMGKPNTSRLRWKATRTTSKARPSGVTPFKPVAGRFISSATTARVGDISAARSSSARAGRTGSTV